MRTNTLVWACVAGLGVAGLSAAPAHAAAKNAATGEELGDPAEAYVALVQADRARDAQDWAGAVRHFSDALRRYKLFQKKRPRWQPEIVSYRISYCEKQLAGIEAQTGKSAEGWLAESAAPKRPAAAAATATATAEDAAIYRERYQALLQETQYLRKRIAEMEQEPPATDATNDLEQLRKENEELKAGLAEAESKAGSADVVSGLQRQVEELREQNSVLTSQLAEAREAPVREVPKPSPETEILELMKSGIAQENAGSFPAALALYERALGIRPTYPEALKAKGRCLLSLGRAADAAPVLQLAVSGRADDAAAQLLLGIAYCSLLRYDDAVGALNEAVRGSPDDARARNALGAAFMGLGEMEKARAELEKAVELDPQLADAHFNLAQVLYAIKPSDPAAARARYDEALRAGSQPDEEFEKLVAAN